MAWPDSTQVPCSDGMFPIACPAPGDPLAQDGSYPGNAPKFHPSGAEILVDERTGLAWQKSPPDTTMSWSQADMACKAFAPVELPGGWRLPTRLEVMSLTDYGLLPTLDPMFTQLSNSTLWTATALATAPGKHFIHDIDYGFNDLALDAMGNAHRCVSGALPGGTPVTGADSVVDPRTGLEWDNAFLDGHTWFDALSYCEASTTGGYTDWRLPNIKELSTLIDDAAPAAPFVDASLFVSLPVSSVIFFSATPEREVPDHIWAIDVEDGRTITNNLPSELYGRRCVRTSP